MVEAGFEPWWSNARAHTLNHSSLPPTTFKEVRARRNIRDRLGNPPNFSDGQLSPTGAKQFARGRAGMETGGGVKVLTPISFNKEQL